MRSGWDATRRNRNQGTAQRGHGQDNRMVVPCTSRSDRPFCEHLRSPVRVTRGIPATLEIYVEPPREDCRHACSVDDLAHVLRRLPAADVRAIAAIVLRQPTRKQALLRPVWGRMIYASSLGRGAGPAIFLEAQPTALRWTVPRAIDPDAQLELDRLRADGHAITRVRRGWQIDSPPAAIRATQLYRTLLHEIGHHVDRLASAGPDERYFARPRRDREAAAHRYADLWGARLRADGSVPFAPILDPDVLRREGLDPAWFCTLA